VLVSGRGAYRKLSGMGTPYFRATKRSCSTVGARWVLTARRILHVQNAYQSFDCLGADEAIETR
jgi:hypothetical protein